MSNEIILNGVAYILESIWRETKEDRSKDSRGVLFPFPKEGSGWSGSEQFVDRLHSVQEFLDQKDMDIATNTSRCIDCKLCDEKCVTTKKYKLNKYYWEDGLMHYITKHNIKPSDEFIEMIYNFIIFKDDSPVKLIGRTKNKNNVKYVKLDVNQIMILDALMKHGGYTKKYIDEKKKNIYRYSEHAGLLDMHATGLEKIIVSGNTNRVDRGDEEIYLPNDLPNMFDYEYMFHTHPPTPKPGGRADDGILYEFPSMGDIFHFIDHYNDGKTIGSLVMTSEGLYNIRKKTMDNKKIEIDEDDFYKEIKQQFRIAQNKAIKKYGVTFTPYIFYSKIAQDKTYIGSINKELSKYGLIIDYFPRKKDPKGLWQVTSIYLQIFDKNHN